MEIKSPKCNALRFIITATLGITLSVIYCAPWILFGEDSFVLIHDHLDSSIPLFKLLADSHSLTASNGAIVSPIMGGVYRSSLPSEVYLLTWVYYFAGPFYGFLLNEILIRIFAFIGMSYFLRQLGGKSCALIIGVSACFAALPFWPPGTLTVAGLPIFFYCINDLRGHNAKDKKLQIAILAMMPLYLDLVLGGWILNLITLYIISRGLIVNKLKAFSSAPVAGSFLHLTISVAANYRLILFVLAPPFRSQRFDFVHVGMTLHQVLWRAKIYLFHGWDHALSVSGIIPIIVLISLLIGLLFKDARAKKVAKLSFALLALSLLSASWHHNATNELAKAIPLLKAFNFSRLYILFPFIWYVLFYLASDISLTAYKTRSALTKATIATFVIVQIGLIYISADFFREKNKSGLTYREFFAEQQFERIKADLLRSTNAPYVLSLGLHPVVASYNGLNTADFYMPNYPAIYKDKFAAMIAPELAHSQRWTKYFSQNNRRLYLYSSELNSLMAPRDSSISTIRIDSEAAEELGITHLISALEIRSLPTYLKLFGTYRDQGSAYLIHVYEFIYPKNLTE